MTSTNGNLKKHSNAKDLLNEEQQNVLERKGSKIERLQAEINQLSKPLLQSEEGEHKWSKHVTPNTLSVFQDEKSWDSINNLEIKRKSQIKDFKEVNGLSWNNMKESMHLESEDDSYSEGGSPVTTQLDAKDRGIFGTMPMEENIVVVKCNNCQRPLLPNKFKEHSETCIGSKKKNGANIKQKDFFSDDEEIDTKKDLKKKKKAVILEEELNSPASTEKRPPSASLEKSEKKKMKKEKQKKTTKQKAPLDLDKQCGVIQGPNNLPCTRSLTCKSHSMGAKRAVEGRTQPYDVLLAAYQKKSIGRPNAKDQVAKKKVGTSTPISSTGLTSGATAGKSIKNLKKLQSQLNMQSGNTSSGQNGNSNKSSHTNQANEEPFVDSDEEVENIMQAFKQSRPTPLAEKRYFFVKRRRQCFRLRDILVDAITPKSTSMTNEHVIPTSQHYLHQPTLLQQHQANINFGGYTANPLMDSTAPATDNSGLFNDSSNPLGATATFFSLR